MRPTHAKSTPLHNRAMLATLTRPAMPLGQVVSLVHHKTIIHLQTIQTRHPFPPPQKKKKRNLINPVFDPSLTS